MRFVADSPMHKSKQAQQGEVQKAPTEQGNREPNKKPTNKDNPHLEIGRGF